MNGERKIDYMAEPGSEVLVVRLMDDNEREMVPMSWGLPISARTGATLTTAQADRIASRPELQEAFWKRRCLIPADGFCEWRANDTQDAPHFIALKDGAIMGFAGIWSSWTNPEGQRVESCSVVTTQANALVKEVHDEMPVIVPPESYDEWLTGTVDQAKAHLRPFPATELVSYPVALTEAATPATHAQS